MSTTTNDASTDKKEPGASANGSVRLLTHEAAQKLHAEHLGTVARVMLPSLFMSLASTAAATLMARKLRKPQLAGDEAAAASGRPIDVATQNIVFVLMPFAVTLDALRMMGELRKSRAQRRARAILFERYARGELSDERFAEMRRELDT